MDNYELPTKFDRGSATVPALDGTNYCPWKKTCIWNPEQQLCLDENMTARQAWDSLAELYQSASLGNVFRLTGEFNAMKQRLNQQAIQFISLVCTAASDLREDISKQKIKWQILGNLLYFLSLAHLSLLYPTLIPQRNPSPLPYQLFSPLPTDPTCLSYAGDEEVFPLQYDLARSTGLLAQIPGQGSKVAEAKGEG